MTTAGVTPLSGIRVLDFSRVIAGPLCTQQLADLGAEVIKVENTVTGDEVRGFDSEGNPARSPFFMAFNRSKKSVALNLKTREGRELASDLAGHCDVLVENFRPGVMDRFGLNNEKLCAKYPQLIYVSISAYGASVPMSDRPGFDPVLQAESGMMELTGETDGSPMRTGLSLIDTLTASHAATAVCAALMARAKNGVGDYLDLALLDTSIAALGNMGLTWLATGQLPTRAGNSHIHGTPTDLFQTASEPIYMAVASNKLFRQLCNDVLLRPELADDPRFVDAIQRRKNRPVLKSIIEAIFATKPAEEWLSQMRHLPAGLVRTLDAALESDEVAARDMVQTITEEDGRISKLLGAPFKFTNAPVQEPFSPPHHGQHTDLVLGGMLGLDGEMLNSLRDKDVIK